MEKCGGATLKNEAGSGSAAGMKAVPPQVVTVDSSTNKLEGDNLSMGVDGATTNARTPKHTNKTSGGPISGRAPQHGQRGTPGHSGSYPSYEWPPVGPPVGDNGAFQSQGEQFDNQSPPVHVSPGGAGSSATAYDRRGPGGASASYNRRGTGGYPPGYYDQRAGYSDYGPPPHMSRLIPHPSGKHIDGPHSHHMRGQHQYPTQPYPPQSYNCYQLDSRNGPSCGNGLSSNYPPGPVQYSPDRAPDQHYLSIHQGYPPSETHAGMNTSVFSRSVSTSFDRSMKEKPLAASGIAAMNQQHYFKNFITEEKEKRGDAALVSNDASWKQLNQLQSVDDTAVREHLGLEQEGTKEDQIKDEEREEPQSNSSSLTNSPVHGASRRSNLAESIGIAAAAAVVKNGGIEKSSSLDELSSVTSTQGHLDSDKKKLSTTPVSPGITDSDSLDLMKCSSDGSGLLNLAPRKDGLFRQEEQRGDKGASATREVELRRAPSDLEEKPLRKKVRMERNDSSKLEKSPLSITCSPSASSAKKGPSVRTLPLSQTSTIAKADYHTSPHLGGNSLYDKPPTYSYSMDSAPSIPRGPDRNKQSFENPTLPPRPTSSSSSALTPGQINIDNQDPANGVVSSIPSWEINAVDSFGAGSVNGGQGLMNNFSFQDYPMFPSSESNLGASGNIRGPHMSPGQSYGNMHPPRMHSHQRNYPSIESRNQSFEGGYYHGGDSFPRTESMDVGYDRGPAQSLRDNGYKHGHQGCFPPYAPSWGTATSNQQKQPHYMGGHPGDYPPVMRNYSQDSGHRVSPPPGMNGPHGRQYMHRSPAGFQPPPEFVAPHNPHLTRRPPPTVYIMSSQGVHHPNTKRGAGVFSWSKEDDTRLTEIMKKYKNPRDWEPIAKEHGMGKTAKDCHERWIRYLKPGVRKGQWTDQEDAIVIDAVQNSSEQPFTRWSDLAQRLPGRVGKQIRDRWVNHLNPNINHLPFSREDDLLLWEGHKKLGKRWVEISTKSFNSVRSENHIKNRWYSASFKKFIANEFGPDAYSGGKSKGKDDKSKTKMKKMKEDSATQAVGM